MRSCLLLGVVLSACQCLEPVDEARQDGGSDAGASDAGKDAGYPDAGRVAECVRSTDCPVVDAGSTFCGGLVASCVDGRCLAECPRAAPRSCSRSQRCLACNGDAGVCAPCEVLGCQGFSVEPIFGTCVAPFTESQAVVVRSHCDGALEIDGGVVGTWVGDFDIQDSLLEIPALGGTCVGQDLFTGARRTLISCPACTFIAFGCD